ncbi:MAG: DoxX family protein [Bacteroidales bacterium]|nr:DoxX family protein [Bacteroidales bacterium]
MKQASGILTRIVNTTDDSKLVFVRMIVGVIFVSEGIQKYLIVSLLGPSYFQDIGFGHAMFWSYFTGTFELLCGLLVIAGLFTRLATIPLLTIMIIAYFTAKLPVLIDKGFLSFAQVYRIDYALTILIVMLLIYGGGRWSADLRILRSPKKRDMGGQDSKNPGNKLPA